MLFKSQIVYRFELFLTVLDTLGRVLFAWLMWGAVFNGRETVNGFTFRTMLLYYVLGAFLNTFVHPTDAGGEVSERIRGGSFSRFMVIPVNPLPNSSSRFSINARFLMRSSRIMASCTPVPSPAFSAAAKSMNVQRTG